MDSRTPKDLSPSFLPILVGLVWACFSIDVLLNLDELLATSGPEDSRIGMATRFVSGVINLHGGTLVGALALALVAAAAIATRRKFAPRSRTVG